jgi:hypothetical protein
MQYDVSTQALPRQIILFRPINEVAKRVKDAVLSDPVLTALVASLTCAFHDGSPVAGQSLDRRREIAIAASPNPIVPAS